MNMRKFLLLALALFLTACAPRAATPTIPPITFSAEQSTPRPEGGKEGGHSVSASATVVPVRQVRLSFPFVGRVAEVLVEEGDEVTTGQALVTLDTTLLEARLAQAQADLASAETQVRYLRRVGTGQEHLDAAQAEVERAQAAVAAAEATLEQATLVAPFDGTVVTVDTAPGETVVPGQVVVLLADLSRMRVETTDLSEQDVSAVREGMPATIYIEALDRELRGHVTRIAYQGTPLGGDVVFTVTIEPDEEVPGLRWGMSAEVTIHITE